MKKPVAKNPSEYECQECNRTGFAIVTQPTRPGIRIYPERCNKCLGKGRIAANKVAFT
jgi:hypothetical protein